MDYIVLFKEVATPHSRIVYACILILNVKKCHFQHPFPGRCFIKVKWGEWEGGLPLGGRREGEPPCSKMGDLSLYSILKYNKSLIFVFSSPAWGRGGGGKKGRGGRTNTDYSQIERGGIDFRRVIVVKVHRLKDLKMMES